MNPIDEQNQNNSGTTSQITFKLTRKEKEEMVKDAESLNVNLSEYCRIKCISIDSDVIRIRNEYTSMQKELRILQVKLNFYKDSTLDENSIVLCLSKGQKEIFEILFGDYDPDANTLGQNIAWALVDFCTSDPIWRLNFADKGIDEEDVNDAF